MQTIGEAISESDYIWSNRKKREEFRKKNRKKKSRRWGKERLKNNKFLVKKIYLIVKEKLPLSYIDFHTQILLFNFSTEIQQKHHP